MARRHDCFIYSTEVFLVVLCTTLSVHGFSLFPSDTYSNHRTNTEELIQDTRPVVLPSRWSDYGAWSSCSRTCGSGIQDRKRECFHKISNELLPDEDCLGEAKQIKLCKQQFCPQGTFSDFRKEECSHLSTAEMTWKPLYYPDDPAINPCWLGCYSNQAISWKIVTQEVPDGTHCVTRSGSGVCIENECLSYGCDGIIGSTKERDICGVCEGEGTSCNVVASTKIVNHLQVGYNEALDIPSGARNVKVFELSGGKNYLALCERSGRYIINGNYRIDNSRLFVASGSLCSYQRLESLERKAGVTHREMFTCSGPINETVTVMILTRDRSPSYLAYEYTLPLDEVSTPPPTALPEASLKPTSVTTEENEGTIQISSNSDPEIVPFSDETQGSHVIPTTSAMLSGINWILADTETPDRTVVEDSLLTTTTTAKNEFDTSTERGVTLQDSVESITARPDLSLLTTGGPVESYPDHSTDFKSLTSSSLDANLGNAENSPQGLSATSAPAMVTLPVKSSSLGQDLQGITDRDVKQTTTLTLEATALPPEDGIFKGSDRYPTRSEEVTPFGEDFTNSRNLEMAATKGFVDFPDDSSFGLDSFFYEFYSENDYTKRPSSDGLLTKGSGTTNPTKTDSGEKLESGENNGVTSSGMEESLLPESIDRRTSKPRGTTIEVQMRPTGRPFVQKEGEEDGEEEDGHHFKTEEMSTSAGSTVEAKGDVVKNTNIGEENSQDEERGDGDISRSEGEETTSTTVVPQLKFEGSPETEQFAAVTLGIHLAELVDPNRSNLTIDNKISSKTGNTTGGKLNIDVADRNLIPNYQLPISNTQERGGKDPSVQAEDRDGHVPPTESTTERDLAKSMSLTSNGSTAVKKDLTTMTTTTTTTTGIVEEQKSTVKTMTTGDELVTTGKRLVTTATVLTTVLPTTQSSKSTSTSPSTSEDTTTSPTARQTTTVAVTTTPKTSTATLTTTPPVTTTAVVTTTAAVRTTEDNNIVPITERPEFIWRVTGHSTCQVTCGRGIRMEYAYCVDREDAIVADNLCNPQTKPEVIPKTCVNKRCEARWEVGAWSSCSVSCGGGVRFRTVSCWRMERSGEDVWEPDTSCHTVEREATMEECSTEACILEWRVGDWSSCSAECGEGHQSRVVQCSVANSSRGHCDRLQRPADRRVCEGTNCHSRWGTSQWPTCTGGCQTQVRRVNCYSPTNSIQLDVNCNHQRKPLSVSVCGSGSCSAQWIAQTWNQDNCGNCQRGFRAREVSCQGVENGVMVQYEEDRCSHLQVPIKRSACNIPSCSRSLQSNPARLQPRWYTTKWSECPVTCGGGQKRRKVRCYQNGAPSHRCDRNSMPPAVHSCSLGDCPVREVCTDNATVKCNVIKQANLCTYKYYAQNCCRTCTR